MIEKKRYLPFANICNLGGRGKEAGPNRSVLPHREKIKLSRKYLVKVIKGTSILRDKLIRFIWLPSQIHNSG